MKIFINTTTWAIVKQENETPILAGNNYVDQLKVYYDSNPSTQYFYPLLNILKPNDRKVGLINFDATSVEEPNPSTYTDDDNNTWYMFKFTLSSDNHQIDVSGKYQFTITTNYYNSTTGVILKQRNINTILSVVNAVTNDDNSVLILGDDPGEVVAELYSLCQSLQTGVASLQISVSALQSGKADLNNPNQDIVAFSITAEHAYLEDIISNSGASITMDSAFGGISFKPVGSNKTITIGAGQIKGIDTVVNNTDAANKKYVVDGLDTKADRSNNAQTITARAIYVGEINDSSNTSQIEPLLLGINFNVKPNESAQYKTFELYSTGFYGFNTTPTRNDQLVNKEYADTKGNKIDLEIDSDFKLKAKLYNGTTLLSTSTVIDLPLESVVVSGEYDATNKKVILTLQDGSTIEFSVADLISGLQSEITAQNKLSSDLVDDTTAANKFVSQQEKNQITANKNAIEEIEEDIPTKTSDLTNDSGFIDETYHDNTKQDVLSGSELARLDNAIINYSGTDTSTNILAFNEDKGIYIGTDTGHWYYWNGTQYADGGVYQATKIADGSVKTSSLQDKSVTLSKLNSDIIGGGIFTLDTIDNRVATPELVLRFNNVDITNLTLKFNYKKLAQSSTWSLIRIKVEKLNQYVQLSSYIGYDDSKIVNTEYTYNHNQDVNLTGAYMIKIFFDRGTTAIGIKTLLYNIELIADGVKIPFLSYDLQDYITTENWNVGYLATQDYVNEKLQGTTEIDLTNRILPNYYSVKDNSLREVPIYLDYILWNLPNDNLDSIYFKNKNDTYYLGEPHTQATDVATYTKTLEFESNKYSIPSVSISQIVTKDSVVNSKINMLVIGDSVTAGFGSDGKQYWKELVTNILNEDTKYSRTTNINMLGTTNRDNIVVDNVSKDVNAEGRSGWSAYDYYGHKDFATSGNPFYDDTLETTCKFSINKWLERYRTMDDNGNRLTLGDGTGSEITSSNINNINVCTPNYIVINLGHNDFYQHNNHRTYYDGILANIRSEFPDVKIIVMVTMPLIHCLHKEFYRKYDMENVATKPNVNYANRYIANVEYWATLNNTDSNLFILPQYNITPTTYAFKWKDVNTNIKAYNHYDSLGDGYGISHPYKTAHEIWGYELYALVKYIIANES